MHEGRGNAIKLLVGVIRALRGDGGVRVASMEGGTARNAIPREATAVVALAGASRHALDARLAAETARLRAELGGVDPGVVVCAEPAVAQEVLRADDESRWLDVLASSPVGVRRMSASVPGVVETSNNLGVLRLSPREAWANLMVRSLVDAEAAALGAEIVAHFAARGLAAATSGAYPGWAPNPDSSLLARCQAVYRRRFGHDAAVKVIHAGLECGIIGAKVPGMDTVSFGPTIRGAHAPGERVEVATVAGCYALLREILTSLA
ncbi:MAG: M20/M25/M40 family metallo-hydrolase [Polyangiales bacterium]